MDAIEGGHLFTCLAVNAGKVVRYPALMASVRVLRVGGYRDAW